LREWQRLASIAIKRQRPIVNLQPVGGIMVDIVRILERLYEERDRVQDAILSIEHLAVKRAGHRADFKVRTEKAARTEGAENQTLLARLLSVEEDERRRISRELHDNLVQQLASLAIDAGGLAADTSPTNGIRTGVQALQARIFTASEEARHIAYQLHPSILDDLGLMISLRTLCLQFAEKEDILVEFETGPLPLAIPLQVASAFYRIAQESLHNVAKYARAKHVKVKLVPLERGLRLSVVDDGIGFDPAVAMHKGRLGLISMEERARLIDAAFSIESQPDHGTRIAVTCPALNASGQALMSQS
jgi:signal transduction histidine kinase